MFGDTLSANVKVALSWEPVNGLNVMDTVHVPPGVTGMAGKQVLRVIAKSAAFTPVIEGLDVNVRADDPVFVIVIVLAWLVVPTICEPNETLAGNPPTPGPAADPVPASGTVCVPGVALSINTSEPFSAAVVVGVNVITTTQLAPDATGVTVEHVVDATTIVKSFALGPVTLGLLENVSAAAPEFVSVTVTWTLVPPFGTVPNCTVPAGKVTVLDGGGGGGGGCDMLTVGALLHADANEHNAATTRTTKRL